MNILISGGCKNGKTAFAERLAVELSNSSPRYYVATMIAADSEDEIRIQNHIDERSGLDFETLEIPRNISSCLDENCGTSTYLIDSITALLANEMFGNPDSAEESGTGDASIAVNNPTDRIISELTEIIKKAGNAVFVADYIFSDAQIYDEYTENYRKALGNISCALAAQCDAVIELCAKNVIIHKGGEVLEKVKDIV